jgi:hypothetical protein
MADQGFLFNNFLNNQPPIDWRNTTNTLKGNAFQSLLQPSAAVEDWRSSPEGYLGRLSALRAQYPKASETDITAAMSVFPQDNALNTALARAVEQSVYNQSGPGMREQLEMGKEMAKEQAKQTLKFQTLANLPGQIERGFAADKYYAGISQIPEIYRGTFASVPNMNVQAPGYSAPQVRYFS